MLIKPLNMTAKQLIEALNNGGYKFGPVGEPVIANGCLVLMTPEQLLDVTRCKWMIPIHRDYITRIIELLEEKKNDS